MKKPKINIEVLKIGGEWKVQFSFGNQYFTLEYGGTKVEATWMASMLRKCFKSYTASLSPKKI